MIATKMPTMRLALFVLLIAVSSLLARADDILFIGNSFTFGASAPVVRLNGGVPKLFQAIARSKGKRVLTFSVTAGGKDWSYHLAQPVTGRMLDARVWTWVVLQDYSARPTHDGNVRQFLQDGETFSDKIAQKSPHAGILLYETWARPAGSFYNGQPDHDFSGPAQMMAELHQSYGRLRDDLAAKNPDREVRVALVGTAFARVAALYPNLNLYASDQHHADSDGYYLAALVIYEAVYHDSVKGAPTQFFHGLLTIPADDAAKLQSVADDVVSGDSK